MQKSLLQGFLFFLEQHDVSLQSGGPGRGTLQPSNLQLRLVQRSLEGVGLGFRVLDIAVELLQLLTEDLVLFGDFFVGRLELGVGHLKLLDVGGLNSSVSFRRSHIRFVSIKEGLEGERQR